MSSAQTAPLAGSPETLQWRMPISPLDYPDHNPLLSEEERRGIEQLLSLSYGQWRAVAHQLAELERITKPLLDVIKLFHQRRPKDVAQRRTPGHTSSTSPNLLLTYLAAYLLTHRLPLTNDKPLRVLAFAQIVFGPSLVQAALDRVKGPWLATGYS